MASYDKLLGSPKTSGVYMKKLLFLLVFPICAFAHQEHNHKVEFFTESNHSYICFDGKFFVHDPDCRCHHTSKYITFETDEHGNAIPSSRKITYEVNPMWEPK